MRNKRISSWMGAAAISGLMACAGQAWADPCSPADLNGDGLVDFSDYLDFLTLYDAQDPRVDFNGDGQVDFADYLEFLNLYDAGCLPTCSPVGDALAATPLGAFPFADRANTFLNTSLVYVSADPAKHPGLTGQTTRVYITANRTWAVGDALTDVRGTFQSVTWAGGSISANTVSLTNSTSLASDAGEDIGVAYDLVIDENSNGVFDECDIVDGIGAEAGFYKIKDMTTVNAGTAVTQINTVSIPVGRTTAGFEDTRWYYPSNIGSRGQIPLVIIAHGNGHNYTWYDFLGQHLASYGYIVISHENNTASGDGVPSASTTLLDHTNTVIALQATLGGGVLNGHINQNEIYWIGHSRGGECVAYGWDRLNRGLYTPTGGHPRVINSGNIKYIQPIAPVDFAGSGRAVGGGTAFTDPGPVDHMTLYGSADGDVSGTPTNPIAWAFDPFERADQRRNAVYIQGADHNDFNCCGFDDFTGPAGTAIGRPGAQAIQKALTLASIKYYRNGNVPCGEVLWRQYETFKPGTTPASGIVDYEFREFGASTKYVIDDYQSNPATGTSSSGAPVSFTVANVAEGLMREATASFSTIDTFNGMTRARTTDNTQGVVFEYDSSVASRNYTLDVAAAGRDTSAFTHLAFRACQITQHPFTLAILADQVFEVELEDGSGNTSRIRINAFGGGIEETYTRSGGWQNEFETIRLRLADFTADGRTLDLTNVTKVRFLFGSSHGTSQGRLAMDDVEFTK